MSLQITSEIERTITLSGQEAEDYRSALRVTVYQQAHIADGVSIDPDHLTPDDGSLLAQRCAGYLSEIHGADVTAEE